MWIRWMPFDFFGLNVKAGGLLCIELLSQLVSYIYNTIRIL